jgi:hypothetical protein
MFSFVLFQEAYERQKDRAVDGYSAADQITNMVISIYFDE